MELKGHRTLSGNDYPRRTSKLSRIGLALTVAATSVYCLLLAGVFTSSVAQAQTSYSEAVKQHPDWVQIPGELIRPDCVHQVPSGAQVAVGKDGQLTGDIMLNGQLIAHYDACPEQAIVTRPQADQPQAPGTGNGWVEADEWNVPLGSNDNIDYLAGTWTVPSYPSRNGALIYLFNGIVPSSSQWILQPVLQYGVSPAGGGNYWAIASWLVSSSQAFYSPLEAVYPGDSITGFTQMTGVSGNTTYWLVEAQDNSSGAYSYLTAWVTNQHWTWAFRGVLEAYNVTSCSNFPANGRAVFSNSVVDHGFPYYYSLGQHWTGAIFQYGGPSCHFAVVANSGTLDF